MHTLTLTIVFAMTFSPIGRAQDRPAPDAAKAAPGKAQTRLGITPLKLLLVISRYQGEKKISSLPYVLSVNADDGRRSPDGQYLPNNKVSLRMGTQVPVISAATPVGDGKMAGSGSIVYKDVGVNIDCYASSTDDGRFNVQITFGDSSVINSDTGDRAKNPNDIVTYRNLFSSESLILKDGQTAQMMTATDKFSGEVVKVDVTLTVVK